MAVSKGDSGARIDAGTAAREPLPYCRADGWAGYDPDDSLNSRLFRALPLRRSRLARLAWIQADLVALKRKTGAQP